MAQRSVPGKVVVGIDLGTTHSCVLVTWAALGDGAGGAAAAGHRWDASRAGTRLLLQTVALPLAIRRGEAPSHLPDHPLLQPRRCLAERRREDHRQ